MPYKPDIFRSRPTQKTEFIEVDPRRTMQTEIKQLFDRSAGLLELINDSPNNILELNPSISLKELPKQIADFLTYELKNHTPSVFGIRLKRSKTLQPILDLDLFVSDNRFGHPDDKIGSYVRVSMSPNSVKVSAWSSEDPISNDALTLVHAVRDLELGNSKAELDFVQYRAALPIMDFIANNLL